MASVPAPFPVGMLRNPRAQPEPARPPGQFEPSRAAPKSNLAKDPCIFQKTRLCKFYPKGQCTRGHSCTFAHGKDQLMPAPELFKTRLCIGFFRTGACQSGEACRFAHSLEELRPVTAPEDPRGGRTAKAAGPQPADAGPPAPFTDREAILHEIESMQQRAQELQASQQGLGGRASPGMQETVQRQLDLMQKQAQMLQVQLQALQALAGRRLPGPAASAPIHPPGPVLPAGAALPGEQAAKAPPPQFCPSDSGASASSRALFSPKKPGVEAARIPGFSRQTTAEPQDDFEDSKGLFTSDFSRQSTATGGEFSRQSTAQASPGDFSRQSSVQAPPADSARQPAPQTDSSAGKSTARGSRDEAPQSALLGARPLRPAPLGTRFPPGGGGHAAAAAAQLRRSAAAGAEGAATQFVGSPLASEVIPDEPDEDSSPALPRISFGRFWSDQAVPMSMRSEEPPPGRAAVRPRPALPVREAPRLSLSVKNTFLHVQGGGAAAAGGPRSRSTPPEAHDPPAAP